MTENEGSSPRNFKAFVWHGLFLAFATTFTEINTVLPALVVQAGGTAFQLGALTAIMVGVPMLAQLFFAGIFTPRPLKKHLLLAGIYMRVLALFGVAWTLSRVTNLQSGGLLIFFVYLWMLLFTTSGAFAGLAYTDILGKSVIGLDRRRFFIIRQIFNSMGILISALIARQVLVQLPYPQNYFVLFLAAGALLFVASGGFLFLKERPTKTTFQAGTFLENLRYIPQALKADSNLRYFVILTNLTGFALTSVPFYIAMAKDRFGLGGESIGNFLLTQILGMLLSNLIWSRLVNRGGFRAVLFATAGLGVALPLLALAVVFWGSGTYYYAVFFVSGMMLSARKIAFDGALLEISTEENRTLYQGIQGAFNVTVAIFPLLGGALITGFGFAPTFFLLSFCLLMAFPVIAKLNCPVERAT
ncbi:MAG: MFS transporter [Candidatus Marinimicrobia bacterium]|nr:MFS transporter [Candidatus Neomarinimicrobiota bacterium]MCF7839356.1 MFS transporter [Candidatus Neomarinimicrobiota bacterium]MCF7901959.1 MFS transporter [Candidatus Neomarinimicrobiota bacterium]